jgi:hypothetical protein
MHIRVRLQTSNQICNLIYIVRLVITVDENNIIYQNHEDKNIDKINKIVDFQGYI